MDRFTEIVVSINTFIWGNWMMFLLVGLHIFYSFATGWVQVRYFGHCVGTAILKPLRGGWRSSGDKGALSSFQTLCVSIGGCIGSGNVVGVATAIVSGGMGAIFWMCFAAFFGMATKYGEIVLSILFRERRKNGEWVGGIMYYIKKGLKLPLLATIAALATVLYFIGSRTLQANTIAGVMQDSFGVSGLITGIGLTALLIVIAAGGLKFLGRVAEFLVPFMTLLWLIISIVVVAFRFQYIPTVFRDIFAQAFSFEAAAGGVGGYVIARAMQFGVARGLYSNAAGTGYSGFFAASADVDHPVKQGIFGVAEVFIDTLLVCVATALVIGLTGMNNDPSATVQTMAIRGFAAIWPPLGMVGAVCLILFCFTTLIGQWVGLSSGLDYMFSSGRLSGVLRFVFPLVCLPGALTESALLWNMQDIAQAFMALPNIVALVLLFPLVRAQTKDYFGNPKLYPKAKRKIPPRGRGRV